MTVDSFDQLMVSFVTKSGFILTHHENRCAAVHHKFLIFHVNNLTEMSQLALELSCREVGRIPEHVPLT